MKNKYLILISLALFLGCSQEDTMHSEFIQLKCSPEVTPEFDGQIVQLVDEFGATIKDTVISKIRKHRKAFKPCREMIYLAEFISNEGVLISSSRIKYMATGKRWIDQPDLQDEIIVQYEFKKDDIDANSKHQLNKTLIRDSWSKEGVEGVVENEEKIWMHPFRANQYSFTEVAPFPKLELPLYVGKTWRSTLSIQNGWGDWANSNGSMFYEIVKKEDLVTPFGKIKECWKVMSKSKFKFGESQLIFWFSKEYGFVKFDYLNYGDQNLKIELVDVIQN